MMLSSPAFQHGAVIPEKYGRDFNNTNPPLVIVRIPSDTKSVVLIMEDPDVQAVAGAAVWVHWLVFNILPTISVIPEQWIADGTRGKNTRGELVYGGPRPPDREHRYFFTVFALNQLLPLSEGATRDEVLREMDGHIIDTAELVGRFAPKMEA